MSINITHSLKRKFQKLFIKWLYVTRDKIKMDGNSQRILAYQICRNLIKRSDSRLLIAPISGKRYIKHDGDNLFIIIEERSIQIINQGYSYTIEVDSYHIHKITNFFDTKIENIRMQMEFNIKNNIQNSLNQIKNELTK
jgi:hypothetical protein